MPLRRKKRIRCCPKEAKSTDAADADGGETRGVPPKAARKTDRGTLEGSVIGGLSYLHRSSERLRARALQVRRHPPSLHQAVVFTAGRKMGVHEGAAVAARHRLRAAKTICRGSSPYLHNNHATPPAKKTAAPPMVPIERGDSCCAWTVTRGTSRAVGLCEREERKGDQRAELN